MIVVEKGLYLRRYGVPDEAIAHVLGHNAMYWYNATQSLGRISMVGATVKDPSVSPLTLLQMKNIVDGWENESILP